MSSVQDLVVSSGEDADCNQLTVPLLILYCFSKTELWGGGSAPDTGRFNCLTWKAKAVRLLSLAPKCSSFLKHRGQQWGQREVLREEEDSAKHPWITNAPRLTVGWSYLHQVFNTKRKCASTEDMLRGYGKQFKRLHSSSALLEAGKHIGLQGFELVQGGNPKHIKSVHRV